jgi:hypothetical protein
MNKTIPQFIKPYLWSYDTKIMSINKDKIRIITNVLNLGSQKATDWLFSIYSKNEIVQIVKNPLPGEWNKKSLNFWQFVLGIKTKANPAKRNIK